MTGALQRQARLATGHACTARRQHYFKMFIIILGKSVGDLQGFCKALRDGETEVGDILGNGTFDSNTPQLTCTVNDNHYSWKHTPCGRHKVQLESNVKTMWELGGITGFPPPPHVLQHGASVGT